MIYLESVGSYIDENTANIYPAFDNGKCDLANPISLLEEEVATDWWEQLNTKDYKIVKKIEHHIFKIS